MSEMTPVASLVRHKIVGLFFVSPPQGALQRIQTPPLSSLTLPAEAVSSQETIYLQDFSPLLYFLFRVDSMDENPPPQLWSPGSKQGDLGPKATRGRCPSLFHGNCAQQEFPYELRKRNESGRRALVPSIPFPIERPILL